MATAESVFADLLSGTAGLTTVIPAARHYKINIHEENPAYPWLVWLPIGNVEEHHTFGSPVGRTTMAQWRLDVFTKTIPGTNGDAQNQQIMWTIAGAIHGYVSSPILHIELDGPAIPVPSDESFEFHRTQHFLVTFIQQDPA